MKKIVLLSFLLMSLAIGAAQALTVLSLNLEQLSHLADHIFVGQVLSAVDGWDPDGRPVVTVTLHVVEGIKGNLGATYQFRQLRSFRSVERGLQESTLLESMPEYKVGAELVLFMSRPSELGLTAPIGIYQGQFEIKKDANGDSVVTNQVHNKNLFLRMESKTALKVLSAGESRLMEDPSPASLKAADFLSIVRKLAQ